ncbi:nicotinate-nucleotide diphosphorylase (carboxylating) [Planctomycetales bacterium]|nr:nicotinate-nucleotide diphosphorylase (carboxylating) [Planctomycetales bacterium]
MLNEFYQHYWEHSVEYDFRRLLEITLSEDVNVSGDITSLALVDTSTYGSATITARQNGILAGMPTIAIITESIDKKLRVTNCLNDAESVTPGTQVAEISGPALSILAAERPILNFISRLSGIATLAEQYVDAVKGTNVKIYDTRKTTPGWRLLEKYAVVCGSGKNHRTGLFDAVLIKDNHLFLGQTTEANFSPAAAVRKAKDFVDQHFSHYVIVEVEVDTLEQLRDVLPETPDIVLLDNMSVEQLQEAVEIRNEISPAVALEASGGINLTTVRAVAETGVERISVGALTHSATALDFGLDWK